MSGNNSSPQSLFAARRRGETAGVTRRGGQAVFAKAAKPKRSAKPTAAAPSERSAGSDLWGAFAGKTSSLPIGADGSTSGSGGSGLVASIAVLGLGLAGLLGTFAAAAARRRRAAEASPAARSGGSTQM